MVATSGGRRMSVLRVSKTPLGRFQEGVFAFPRLLSGLSFVWGFEFQASPASRGLQVSPQTKA